MNLEGVGNKMGLIPKVTLNHRNVPWFMAVLLTIVLPILYVVSFLGIIRITAKKRHAN